jgi:hypothetical protein
MSYEYKLVFDDAVLVERVMQSLKLSDSCTKKQVQEVYLKDKELKTTAEYDAKLSQETDKSIWLEINFKSPNLYKLLQDSLKGASVRCYEDGDLSDEVSLEEAFRIKTDE